MMNSSIVQFNIAFAESRVLAFLFVNGENSNINLSGFDEFLKEVKPLDTLGIFKNIVESNFSIEVRKNSITKVTQYLFRYLKQNASISIRNNDLIRKVISGNQNIDIVIKRIRIELKRIHEETSSFGIGPRIKILFQALTIITSHYNMVIIAVFSHLRRIYPQYENCLLFLQSYYGEANDCLKNIIRQITLGVEYEDLVKEAGKLFFLIYPIKYRKELVLVSLLFQKY